MATLPVGTEAGDRREGTGLQPQQGAERGCSGSSGRRWGLVGAERWTDQGRDRCGLCSGLSGYQVGGASSLGRVLVTLQGTLNEA